LPERPTNISSATSTNIPPTALRLKTTCPGFKAEATTSGTWTIILIEGDTGK